MKIISARVAFVQVTDEDRLALDDARKPTTRDVVVVQIATDDGYEGLAAGFLFGGLTNALHSATEEMAALLVGMDAARIEAVHEKLIKHVDKLRHVGIFRVALSLFDIALWDIAGKAAGQPLWKLFGGTNDRMPVYASGQMDRSLSDDVLARSAAQVAESGFKHAKLHLGLPDGADPAREIERAKLAQDALGPGVRLQADVNDRFAVHRAVDIGHRLQDAGVRLSILEDPIDHTDLDGLAHVTRALTTPVMAGESNWGVAPFRQMIEKRAVDILMVDLLQVGGYTAARKVAAMAEGANFPIVTHLLPEYSVHLGAGVPNGLICEHKEWLWPLFDGLPVLKDGEAFLSERPGHGLALAPAYRDIF